MITKHDPSLAYICEPTAPKYADFSGIAVLIIAESVQLKKESVILNTIEWSCESTLAC